MNIVKRFIRKIQKKNPYVETQLENADIIIGEKENLTREQRRKRFDDYYKEKNKKNRKTTPKTGEKRTI
jgi:G3E family GTPase